VQRAASARSVRLLRAAGWVAIIGGLRRASPAAIGALPSTSVSLIFTYTISSFHQRQRQPRRLHLRQRLLLFPSMPGLAAAGASPLAREPDKECLHLSALSSLLVLSPTHDDPRTLPSLLRRDTCDAAAPACWFLVIAYLVHQRWLVFYILFIGLLVSLLFTFTFIFTFTFTCTSTSTSTPTFIAPSSASHEALAARPGFCPKLHQVTS
jgi:hypothetical protein